MNTQEAIEIKICMPSHSGPEPECLQSIQNLYKLEKFKFTHDELVSGSVVHARNLLLKDYKKYKYVLFVDTDSAFTNANFLDLWNADKDIIGACMQHLVGKHIVAEGELPWDYNEGVLLRKWTGTGLMLIKCSALDRIGKPFFAMPPDGEGVESEDQYFCRMAREADLEVHLHTGVKAKHLDTKSFLNVRLTPTQWENVVSAVLELPMPFAVSSRLVHDLRLQLNQ